MLLEDEALQSLEVDQEQTQLGTQSGTFVFFNACSTGASGRTLGSPSGWPVAFLARGFRGYLAPISRVWEKGADLFARQFAEQALTKKIPIGEALLEVRRQKQGQPWSLTCLAYVYYGDVMTQFA